jgi:hypothetical protein
LLCSVLALAGAPATRAADSLLLRDLCAVVLPREASAPEREAARALVEALRRHYRLNVPLQERGTACRPAIHIGASALAAGLLAPGEARDPGPDGFRLRTGAAGVALVGGGPAGNVYAVYAFLRQAGVRHYPWRLGGGLDVFEPLPDGRLPALDVRDAPVFEFRDVAPQLDRGRYGGSLREFSLGDLRFANDDPEFRPGGWVNWDHTAGWLVPRSRYGDHPEYFADTGERNPLAAVPTHRSALCSCEPAVATIAAGRLREWLGRQPGRRWYAITDGDVARPRCPRCEPTDPHPDYYTDRLLEWVNPVARSAGTGAEGARFFTLAYMGTVKPPVRVAPAAEVVVLYSPWYWTSRGSSAVGYGHPLNMIASVELDGWLSRFPGQVGAVDFPGDWVFGAAARIQELAARGARWMYFNAPQGDLLQWVATRLLWDPQQDVAALVQEFTAAYYGRAAPPMQQYLELQRRTIEANALETNRVFASRAYGEQAAALLARAAGLAAGATPGERLRILEGMADGLRTVLEGSADVELPPALAADVAARFVTAHATLGELLAHQPGPPQAAAWHRAALAEDLGRLGVRLDGGAREDLGRMLEIAGEQLLPAPPRPAMQPLPPRELALSAAGEAQRWRVASFPAGAARPAVALRTLPPAGAAVVIEAPLERLPAGLRGQQRTHFGRVHARRDIEPALPVAAGDSVRLQVSASVPVPVTVYLTIGGQRLRADVQLAAGEQIVRIPLAGFAKAPKGTGAGLRALALDLWPQDSFYPYPPARAVTVALHALGITGSEPAPADLPAATPTLWLAAFRPNLTHGDGALARIAEACVAQGGSRADVLGDYARSQGEAFRSFTPQRLVTPLRAIVATGPATATATELQQRLQRAFGVRLPVVAQAPGNAIWLGAQAAVASGLVTAAEIEASGRGGYLLRAAGSGMVIAGADVGGDRAGVERWLALEAAGTRGFVHEWFLRERQTGAPQAARRSE